MTLLLPVLLDKVPNFYVPGKFDAELDSYSQTADSNSMKLLEQKRKEAPAPVTECAPDSIAEVWLKQLDTAIAKHDASAIIAMFSSDAAVRAAVRSEDGTMTSVDIRRDEFVQSTIAALKGLENYKQRRVWTKAKQVYNDDTCDRISLKSVVIEQGLQSGKPYRFESLEEYVIELRDGKWISVSAETTQQ
jgi:hypothetical protein